MDFIIEDTGLEREGCIVLLSNIVPVREAHLSLVVQDAHGQICVRPHDLFQNHLV